MPRRVAITGIGAVSPLGPWPGPLEEALLLGALGESGDLANVLTTLDEAIVRPSAGIAYVPHRVGGVPDADARRLHRALKERFDPAGVLT